MDIMDWINNGNDLEAKQKARDIEDAEAVKALKKANSKTSPFEFITSIQEKNYIFCDRIAKHYVPHVVCMGLSQHVQNIGHCREASKLQLNLAGLHPELANKMHYDYLFNAIRKGKQFGKWAKVEKYDNLELIMETYKVNRDEGIKILDRLSKKDIKAIIEWDEGKAGGLQK